MAPVRGFATLEAAQQWGRAHGRSVVVEAVMEGIVWGLPDHHQDCGTAWWTPCDVRKYRVVELSG